MDSKFVTVCGRCSGIIDVGSPIDASGRFHDGCQPGRPMQGPGREGRGAVDQIVSVHGAGSGRSETAFGARQHAANRIAVDAEGAVPASATTIAPTMINDRRTPTLSFQERTAREARFENVAEYELRKHGIEVTSPGTLKKLHRLGCTLDMLARAIQIAAKYDRLHIGYVYALCKRWAADPQQWELYRDLKPVKTGAGSRWTSNQIDELRDLVIHEQVEIPELAVMFERTEVAIQNAVAKHVPEVAGHRLYPAYPEQVPPLGTKYRVASFAELRQTI